MAGPKRAYESQGPPVQPVREKKGLVASYGGGQSFNIIIFILASVKFQVDSAFIPMIS